MCKDIRESSLYIMSKVKRTLLNNPWTHNSCPSEGPKKIKIYPLFSGTIFLVCTLLANSYTFHHTSCIISRVQDCYGIKQGFGGCNHYKNIWIILE